MPAQGLTPSFSGRFPTLCGFSNFVIWLVGVARSGASRLSSPAMPTKVKRAGGTSLGSSAALPWPGPWRHARSSPPKLRIGVTRITSAKRELTEPAVEWWGEAGRRSLDRSASVEAVEQFTRALAQIGTLPSTPRFRREETIFRSLS
jgi:hypothetical protein